MKPTTLLPLLLVFNSAFALHCFYSTQNSWEFFRIRYENYGNGTQSWNVTDDVGTDYFFGTKYCLDARSRFLPYSFWLNKFHWQIHIKLGSVSKYEQKLSHQDFVQRAVQDLPNMVPTTFSCCCRDVDSHSLDCLCPHVPECGLSPDEAGGQISEALRSAMGSIFNALSPQTIFNETADSDEDLQQQFLQARQTIPECESSDDPSIVVVPVSHQLKLKQTTFSFAFCFHWRNTGFKIIEKDNLLGLAASPTAKCHCEPWTKTHQQWTSYFQYSTMVASFLQDVFQNFMHL